jgi:hypothetical protein
MVTTTPRVKFLRWSNISPLKYICIYYESLKILKFKLIYDIFIIIINELSKYLKQQKNYVMDLRFIFIYNVVLGICNIIYYIYIGGNNGSWG